MADRIYLCLAHMSGNEMKYIQEAFETNWVVPLGPNVNAFEKDLEDFVGEGKHVVPLSAGTAAIHLALVYLGVEKGEKRDVTKSEGSNRTISLPSYLYKCTYLMVIIRHVILDILEIFLSQMYTVYSIYNI